MMTSKGAKRMFFVRRVLQFTAIARFITVPRSTSLRAVAYRPGKEQADFNYVGPVALSSWNSHA